MTPRGLRLPVTLALETMWLAVALALLVAGTDRPQAPSIFAVGAALSVGCAAAVIAQHLELDGTAARWVGLGVGIAGLALVLRAEYAGDLAVWRPGIVDDLLSSPQTTYEAHPGGVLGGIGLLAVWMRGAWLARESEASPDANMRAFLIGMSVVALGLAFVDEAETEVARSVALPFGALGFLSLALDRAASSPGAGESLPRWWVATLGGGIAGTLALAAALAFLPWGALEDPLTTLGDGLLWVIGWVLVIVLTPFVLAVELLLRGVFALAGNTFDLEMSSELADVRDAPRDAGEGSSPLPGWFDDALRWGAVVLGLGAAAWAASLLFRRARRQPRDEPERGSLNSAGPGGGWWRFGGRGRGGERPGGGAIGKLYGEVLRDAARRGCDRPPAATPLEFAPLVHERLDLPVALDISAAFSRARYGALLPSEDEVDELRRAFRAQRDAAD